MSYESIFQDIISILNSYNSDYSTEYQVNTYYQKKNASVNETVLRFVNGCIVNKNALEVLIRNYYETDGKLVLHSEENIYKFVAYLVLFCLKDIGINEIKKFIRSIDAQKIIRFLQFMINEKNLKSKIKDGWIVYYEEGYVNTYFLTPILDALPQVNMMLKNIKKTIDIDSNQNTIKPITRPYSFDMSEIRSKKVIVPVEITETIKSNNIPKSLYENPKHFETLKDISKRNKQRAEKLLITSKINQPKCAIQRNITKSLDDLECVDKKFKAKPIPELNGNIIPVKLNTATILKQGKLYKKETEEIFKQLNELEKGASDSQEFIRWQTEMKNMDHEKLTLELEMRKLKGKLSYEEAIVSKEKIALKNKEKAENVKAEKNFFKEKSINIKIEEEQKIKEIVDKINQSRINNKIKQVDVRERKQKIVKEINEKSEDLLNQAVKTAEEEMQKKMELIQKIKAIESIPVLKTTFIDLTSTAGHMFLSEMSIAELKERIKILHDKKLNEKEEKHDVIIKNKLEKDQNLVDTLEYINTIKNSKIENLRKNEEKQIIIEEKKTNENIINLNSRFLNLKNSRKNYRNINNAIPDKIINYNGNKNLNYVAQRKIYEMNRM